jgi:hypothetical protein
MPITLTNATSIAEHHTRTRRFVADPRSWLALDDIIGIPNPAALAPAVAFSEIVSVQQFIPMQSAVHDRSAVEAPSRGIMVKLRCSRCPSLRRKA